VLALSRKSTEVVIVSTRLYGLDRVRPSTTNAMPLRTREAIANELYLGGGLLVTERDTCDESWEQVLPDILEESQPHGNDGSSGEI
jgi:hypothetical protein